MQRPNREEAVRMSPGHSPELAILNPTSFFSRRPRLGLAHLLVFWLCVFGLSFAALGCHTIAPMRPVGIDQFSPEKDVLVFHISIEEPSTPRSYRDWAQAQLDLVGGEPRNRRYPEIPIYEVTYRFRVSREMVAEVTFRRGDDGEGALEHAQTVVRAVPEWLIKEESP